MADTGKRFTNNRVDLLSKAQEKSNSSKQQAASSSAAVKSGSTTVPTTTQTPKVTNTAKAMPSIQRVDISKIAPKTATTQTTGKRMPTTTNINKVDISKIAPQTNTVSLDDAMNLFGQKTQITGLKKAQTPDMLDGDTGRTSLSATLNKWLREVPEAITQQFGEKLTGSKAYGKTVDFFSNTAIDLARTGISQAQGVLNKIYNSDKLLPSSNWLTPVTGFAGKWLTDYTNKALDDSMLGTYLRNKRDSALKNIFDETEKRDQILATDETYKQTKKEADQWAKEGKSIRKAIDEGNWDVVLTRVGETVAQMLPTLAVAAFTKNPQLTVGTIFSTVYFDAYQRNLREVVKDPQYSGLTGGQKDDLASLLATTEASIESLGDLLEFAPFLKGKLSISKMLGLKNVLASFVANRQGGAVTEGLEEVSTEVLQTLLKQAYGSSDSVTLKELGQIFGDTYLIMQIAGLMGGAGGAVETKNRNTVVNALSHEAEKYDNFNDFEASAKRGGIEDNSLIQEAWAKSKGLSKQDTQILAYDVNYVENQEKEATKLYEERERVETQLKSESNEDQISKLNNRLQEIDNQIQEIDKSIQEYMDVYGDRSETKETQKALEELYNEINGTQKEGENLSTNTMRDISEEEEPEEEESVKIPNSPEGYVSLAEELKQPGNTYLSNLSDSQLKMLKSEVQDTWKYEGFYGYNNNSYRYLIKAINAELEQREAKEKKAAVKKLIVKNAKDYVKKMIDIDKKNGVWSKGKVDKNLRDKYFGWFIRNNIEGDFSAHLPGLKGIDLKQIEGKLTDKNLRDIAEMIALVSRTFGIDFNKIISDSNISVNIVDNQKDFLYNTGNLGLMSWMPTKEQVKDLIKRTGHGNMGLAGDIIKMGVAITLDRGLGWSGSTMAHELMHLLDFAISTEEGLPLKYDNGTDYTSSIEGDYDWKTFKVGTYKPSYYNRWTEILARYAQQYFSWKNNPEIFKEYCKKPWYWSEDEFLKLVPKFESFLKDRLGTKLLDEENQFYYDVVRRINSGMYNYKELQYNTEGMNQTEVQLKLLQIETEYARILQTVEGMKGDLKEEMEAYVQLSNLQSNYEMAKAKGEEYLEKLKTTPKQQETIDNVTTTVLPPEETPNNSNPTPPENPETIKNGLPQLGGSNIENGIGNIANGGNGEQLGESYMSEEAIVKIRKKKNKIKAFKKGLSQTWNDLFTPAITRIYNISPRIAGRLITMEAQTDINIHRYREKARGFVESLGKLKGKQALEVKMALLDYGALASEQGENIEEYKKEEVAKLKEVLKRNGFKEKDINDMFSVLDDIGKQYKDAGLDITLTDMYFPRVVKDYEGLIDYMNRVSGKDIKVNKTSLLIRINQIQADPNMTDAEKERRIRNVITMEFKQPGTTSKHGKERKMGKLSDWGEGVFAYYENPIESLDHYITTMVNAIQRQLFLGGLREDANLEGDIVNESTAESISQIIGNLVEQGMVNEDDVEVLQKSILAILNKAPSPKIVTTTKNITYVATITNFLSAINQLDDLGMTILKDRSGLKNVVKAIFGKANIKYDELGLEDSYEMFREGMGITNWLFKKSGFNFFDRLGKTSFVNAAWESMVRQAKNKKTREYLYTRLEAMYGKESADRMMEKIDSGNYNGDDGQIDIEILRDLLYQLGSTQPIFTSAMPTTYLNHPWSRLCYALSSFTLKRIDWLVQGTREVNAKHGAVAAGAWLMGVSTYLAIFGMIIGDAGDYLKGKKEDTFLWKLLNEGIDEALKAGGSNALDSWLKIWDLSEYDIKTYKQQGLWGVFSAKIKPFVFDLGKDLKEAIVEHDKDEITDLAKYVPIFGKLVYYWCWEDLGKKTKKDDGDFELNLDSDFDLNLDNDFELNLDDDFELNL